MINVKCKVDTLIGFTLAFPRDKEIFLSRCPFVPGQGQEQKSQDKLLCPGTKWIYIYLIALKIFRKNDKIFRTSFPCFRTSFSCFRTSFSVFRTSFSCFRMSFSALSRLSRGKGRDRLSKSCTVPSHVPSRILRGCPSPSRPLARNWAWPFVPKSWTVLSCWKR